MHEMNLVLHTNIAWLHRHLKNIELLNLK